MVDNGARTPGGSSSASGGGVFTIPTNIPPPPQYCSGPCTDLSPTQHALQHSMGGESQSNAQSFQTQDNQQYSSQTDHIHINEQGANMYNHQISAPSSTPSATPASSSALPASQSTALPAQLSVAVMSSPKTVGVITPGAGLDPKHYKTLQQYQQQYPITSQQQHMLGSHHCKSTIAEHHPHPIMQHRGFSSSIQPSAIHYVEPQPGLTLGYSTLPRTGQASVVVTNEGTSTTVGAYLDLSVSQNRNPAHVISWSPVQHGHNANTPQKEDGEESAV